MNMHIRHMTHSICELSQPTVRLIISVVGPLGVLASFLIISLNHGNSALGDEDTISSLPLQIALKSEETHNSLVSTIALSALLLIELLLDSFNSTTKITMASTAVWILCLSVILPSYIIYFCVNSENLYLMPGIMNSKNLLLVSSSLLLISEYGKHIVNHLYILLALGFYITFQVLACGAVFDSDGKLYTILITTAHILGYFFLLINVAKWFRYIYLNNSMLSKDDLLCTGILVSFLVISIGAVIVNNTMGYGTIFYRDELYFSAMNYLHTAYAVGVITVHGRVHRYEAGRLHERKEHQLNQKRSFVRHVSHEIRTPLSTVTMGIQLLKRSLNTCGDVDLKELNDIVSDLEGSCETAIEILNELLDYEKLEAGIMTIDKTRVMMKGLLDKNIRPFHLHANQKNIDLRVNYEIQSDFEIRQAYVMGDQYKLSQVVRNIMSNGLKFTNHGGVVTVTIGVIVVGCNSSNNRSVSGVTPVAYKLRVTVQDNGPGISKENQGRLFHQIIQFNPGELQGGKGSGLGLWISNRIMELHEGTISVFSEGEGFGCTFTIELPVMFDTDFDVNEADEKVNETIDENVHINNIHRSINNRSIKSIDVIERKIPIKSLIVDDVAMNRKMLGRLVADVFNEVDFADDGLQALEMVRSAMENGQGYGLVLMDYQMPVMDGPSAAKAIREMGFTGPIIGVTGNALSSDINYFMSLGANKVLVKPIVSVDQILNAICEYFP